MAAFRQFMTVGFSLLVWAGTASAGEGRNPDPADVDRLATAALKAWDVPGVAVVVVCSGGADLVKGFGVRAAGTADPITPDTVFPLASCTKAFTSTLLAVLVDEGKLDWDDPVRKHLPGFRLSDPHADALVTLRDLLSHRTGVGGHDLLWYRAPWGRDEILRRVSKLPVEKPFRASYEYSTLMYLAAGAALVNRAGRPWDELVRDRITSPLGMAGVTFHTSDPAFRSAERATGHKRTKGGALETVPWYEVPEPNPAGSINVPAKALVPWLRFHLSGGIHAGRRLVSEANLVETRTPQTIIPMDRNLRRQNPDTVQMTYGMGWLVYDYRGRRVAAHGGMIDGFRVQLTLLPDDGVGVALLNNLHDTKMNQALTNALVDHVLGLPAKDWNAILLTSVKAEQAEKRAAIEARDRARRPDVKPSLALDRYAGEYGEAAYGTGRVKSKDGRLVWEWSSFRAPLEHWAGDVFRITDGFLEDQFVEFRGTPAGPDALRFMGVVFERRP